jgi:hypothetical protein
MMSVEWAKWTFHFKLSFKEVIGFPRECLKFHLYLLEWLSLLIRVFPRFSADFMIFRKEWNTSSLMRVLILGMRTTFSSVIIYEIFFLPRFTWKWTPWQRGLHDSQDPSEESFSLLLVDEMPFVSGHDKCCLPWILAWFWIWDKKFSATWTKGKGSLIDGNTQFFRCRCILSLDFIVVSIRNITYCSVCWKQPGTGFFSSEYLLLWSLSICICVQ